MKAVVYEQYGPPEVLQLKEVPRPVPGAEEILVRVNATSVCAADWRLRKPDPFAARLFNGLLRPRKITILGMEFAGEVAAVGAKVRGWQPGDPLFGSAEFKFGCYAEYVCLPAEGVVAPKPANISFEEAAAVPFGGLGAAFYFRRVHQLQPGQQALIYGASGSTGTYAVQLARHFGAEVTAVCSAGNFELAHALGAEHTIDYRTEDFTERPERYDFIFDAVGKIPGSQRKKALAPGGTFATITKGGGSTAQRAEDLLFLKELVEGGEMRAVIDRSYPLEQIVEAHRYVEAGHKRGNVVITVAEDGSR
jgi:NADPH:quinone reductase-like Zn-dependent oxidoreductase